MEAQRQTVYIPYFRTPVEPQVKLLEPVADIVSDEARDEDHLIVILKKVDAALLTLKMTHSVIRACPHLKVIGKYGIRVDNIDIATATEMGIPVTNTPSNNTSKNSRAVAEFTIGLILACMGGLQYAKEHLKRRGWSDDYLPGSEITGSVIDIIGYGSIAQSVKRILRDFDVKKIQVFTETRSKEACSHEGVEITDLPTLMRSPDIVSIHKALTTESRGLIGEKELRMMRPSAYLINISRGPLIDEKALIQALREKWIAGAALYVYEQEPLRSDHPFLEMTNIVVTPHIRGTNFRAWEEMVTTVVGNVVKFLQGREVDPAFIMNPEVLGRDRGKEKGN